MSISRVGCLSVNVEGLSFVVWLILAIFCYISWTNFFAFESFFGLFEGNDIVASIVTNRNVSIVGLEVRLFVYIGCFGVRLTLNY